MPALNSVGNAWGRSNIPLQPRAYPTKRSRSPIIWLKVRLAFLDRQNDEYPRRAHRPQRNAARGGRRAAGLRCSADETAGSERHRALDGVALQIQHLHSIGLEDIKAEHVLTSGGIARGVLEQRRLRPLLLVDPSLEEEFDGLDRTNPNAVVVGLAPEHFHYAKLNEAFRVLLEGGSLVALHEARYFAGKDGLNIGPGAFVKALEFSAGVQATIIG
ncbi:hypothetical protein ON010_g9950 [Phytophthora cinnamomi]|nr:hypothetical protein ON010_g9950 [Phytophthora cinnamomi]